MIGKTTQLIDEAVSRLADLPSDARIYFTGAHTKWVKQLQQEFKEAGLVDVEFVTPTAVMNGALRGCKGILLIDDMYDLSPRDIVKLTKEGKWIEAKLPPTNF